MNRKLGAVIVLAAATADPLATVRRGTNAACSTTLETVMLLVQLAKAEAGASEFQGQARARFGVAANHPAVRETAALMEHGFGCTELARLSTFMGAAPHFLLIESEELGELAALLPADDARFNLDRLHGYAKLVREFYWDWHVGRFLRGALPQYQQAVRQPLPAGLPQGAKVLVSPMAPSGRLEFERRTPRPVSYVVLGL